MLREEVTETDIADIISKWSGIPVTKLVASERSKLLGLSDELHKRVIGQDEAVEAVADAIQRWPPAHPNPNLRPIFPPITNHKHKSQAQVMAPITPSTQISNLKNPVRIRYL